MGVFDFVKDAGEKILGMVGMGSDEEKERETATALKRLVSNMGLEIQNLDVSYSDGVAQISGTAVSQAEREKAVLLMGNTAGVSRVDDQLRVLPPKPEAPPEPPAVFYTVKRGDSLSKIAKEHYGNAMKYPVIFEANKPMLKDPDKIYPGQVLRIPPLDI